MDKTDTPTMLEKMQESLRKLREMGPTNFERSVVTALHDIYRRVFEEPWFGKPVFDILYNYTNRLGQERNRLKNHPDQDLGKPESQGFSHDYSPDAFYGRNQGQEKDQHEAPQQEYGRGMER